MGIDLSSDWTNATLEIVLTPRPNTSIPLNNERLWWDETSGAYYSFGGEVSGAFKHGNDYTGWIASIPPEYIWQFTPDGNGSGTWKETVGPTSLMPYPPGLVRTSQGASAQDSNHGYYIGGHTNSILSPKVDSSDPYATSQVPGLQTFTFESSTLTNSSNDGHYFASYGEGDGVVSDPGVMIFVPSFGSDQGLLLLMGGYSHPARGGYFNEITIYDLASQSWYSQATTGRIPRPRSRFCAVGVQEHNSAIYQM